MRRFALTVLVALWSVAACAQSLPGKSQSNFPRLIVNGTWVYVTAYTGDELNPRLLPEDRRAIFAVQDEIKKWGRYKLVYHPEEADLTLVVRCGRLAGLGGGVIVGGSSTRPVGVGSVGTAEAGNPDDTLFVMRGGPRPLESAPLWWRSRAHGLDSPDLKLFQEFKKQVEEAAASKKP